MKLVTINRIIIFLLLVLLVYYYLYDGTSSFQSYINNSDYKVRSGSTNMREIKANLLANLYNKLEKIVEKLKSDSSFDNDEAVQRLIKNWDRGITIKETGFFENDAAYVINKQYMSVCLVNFCNKKSCTNINSLENLNLLTYVGIHELAHIMSVEIGHGTEFKINFRFLLNYAKDMKYFDPLLNKEIPLYIDLYNLNTPDNFCGVSIINSIS
jgi:hypothetical protein